MSIDSTNREDSTPVRKDFLVFGAPQIQDDEINSVVDSMRSGWLGTGPKVAMFEEMFQHYTGAEHAMALNSCTAGLHLSMLVAGLGPGDEVITTPMTFCATVNTIIHAGATPVLVDCERETQLIDPQKIEDAITPNTRAIVPVHFEPVHQSLQFDLLDIVLQTLIPMPFDILIWLEHILPF